VLNIENEEQSSSCLILTSAGQALIWQNWEDVYIVYQPSSTETHIFNDITAAVLHSLEKSTLTVTEVVERTTQELDLDQNELSSGDLSFALGRLEELGLVEWSDAAAR
jgi:PqqD family protein of HPr-rel-A system